MNDPLNTVRASLNEENERHRKKKERTTAAFIAAPMVGVLTLCLVAVYMYLPH